MSTAPVIIHQMAKVGSTAIQVSLQQKGLETLQTHHLGLPILQALLHEQLDPLMSIERVKHEMNLFTDQMLATKYIYLSQQQKPAQPLKLITLTREPIDRWFSSLVQNYAFHLSTAKKFYALERMSSPGSDLQCFDFAIEKILEILKNSPYPLGSNEFNEYLATEKLTHSGESGQQLKLLGNELLVPFHWFQNNSPILNIEFFDGPPVKDYQHYQTPHIEVLLLKFEYLKNSPEETETLIQNFLKLEQFTLLHTNISKEKVGFDIIKSIKNKYYSQLNALMAIEQSSYCQHFSYSTSIDNK